MCAVSAPPSSPVRPRDNKLSDDDDANKISSEPLNVIPVIPKYGCAGLHFNSYPWQLHKYYISLTTHGTFSLLSSEILLVIQPNTDFLSTWSRSNVWGPAIPDIQKVFCVCLLHIITNFFSGPLLGLIIFCEDFL
jgi:hypothetical protein